MKIEMSRWGKDHWSTLAFIECRVVDHQGRIDHNRMRTDIDVHPELEGSIGASFDMPNKKYPTRLNDGEQPDHDDWSCLEDMESEGLIVWPNKATCNAGNPAIVQLTPNGAEVAAALRRHKQVGGKFADFKP